jgi:pantoate--beta-alanine ligase
MSPADGDMRVVRTVGEMREARAALADEVGFVPTMGYLHDGHLSLVRRARAENKALVVSIFVNPPQFGPQDDYDRYPRDEERDLALLAAENVEVAFLPSKAEMYPDGFNDWVEVEGALTERLEGASRPGHFRSVTTVVARLFDIVRPQRAYFGEKDAQQFRVIRRMVAELGLSVEVVACPTVREPDGLAMSSRNVYLLPEELRAALVIPRALELAEKLIVYWRLRDAELVKESLQMYIRQKPQAAIDYISVADVETLEELETIDRPALVSLAVRIGSTRLIDNVTVSPPSH